MYIDWKAAKIAAIVFPLIVIFAAIVGVITYGIILLASKLLMMVPYISPGIVGWFWAIVGFFGFLCSFDIIRFGKKPKK